MRIDNYTDIVDVDLTAGIYQFEDDSATGKTRLCELLKKYRAYGEKVYAYTYNDLLVGIDFESDVKQQEYKVVMLDRYDMYKGRFSETIKELSKSCVVLIDCKHELGINSLVHLAEIELRPNAVLVY